MLIITWKRRAIDLSNKKYEIIENKEMQKLVIWINLLFTTDMINMLGLKIGKNKITN